MVIYEENMNIIVPDKIAFLKDGFDSDKKIYIVYCRQNYKSNKVDF